MASYYTYQAGTGFAWLPCADMASGSSDPPAVAPPTGDVVVTFGNEGGTLTRWDTIVIVDANGPSPAVVTLPLALAGPVGLKATIVSLGSAPVQVAVSGTDAIPSYPSLGRNESAVYAPTNHGQVHRLSGPAVKAHVYAQRGTNDTFIPNDDALTKIAGWNVLESVGEDFDGSTFTAPNAGAYAVSAAVLGEHSLWNGGGTLRLCVVKNGVCVFTTFWSPPLNGLSYYAPINIACTVRCDVGDELWVAMRSTRSGGATALVASAYENTLSITEL
jgi:hypothetical protein